MGREQPSRGEEPAAFRKNARSKKAKATLNKVIPPLLTTHPRAKKGVSSSELVAQPKAQQPPAPSKDKNGEVAKSTAYPHPQLELRVADTLTAARQLLEDAVTGKHDLSNRNARVGILNMASMLAPGGGFENGANSQEASLCMRTTLLPSLSDEFYRLPEVGGVFTPDVLVFRDEQADDLDKKDRWFVDCVSAGMLRFPSVTVDDTTGRGSYASDKDRALVLEKMRAVMRIFQSKKVSKIVLGAWGCGAFGNPVGEIAAAWRKVLLGSKQTNRFAKGKFESWTGIETVVFAVKDAGLADAFEQAFGEGLQRESADDSDHEDDGGDDDPEVERIRELQAKIEEMQGRIQQAKTPQLKEGLSSILAGLQMQLPDDTSIGEGRKAAGGSDQDEEEDDSVNNSDSDSETRA